MAKAASSLVLPIIFLVMFLVQTNMLNRKMGYPTFIYGRFIGPCSVNGKCGRACKFVFGPTANGGCDIAGTKQCICQYPCRNNKTHT
ncbi:hypothetical protein EUTSA_v10028341mg [Eutrema salsugineum]|uniref:Uncharacterized protein n=1 Tax=Eutrema salsugineum TaxID=72664 RepID=V4LA67_EUTSA|nr:hypothetical protein EUTSA_v10028341mg [Eutrema salsugineum]